MTKIPPLQKKTSVGADTFGNWASLLEWLADVNHFPADFMSDEDWDAFQALTEYLNVREVQERNNEPQEAGRHDDPPILPPRGFSHTTIPSLIEGITIQVPNNTQDADPEYIDVGLMTTEQGNWYGYLDDERMELPQTLYRVWPLVRVSGHEFLVMGMWEKHRSDGTPDEVVDTIMDLRAPDVQNIIMDIVRQLPTPEPSPKPYSITPTTGPDTPIGEVTHRLLEISVEFHDAPDVGWVDEIMSEAGRAVVETLHEDQPEHVVVAEARVVDPNYEPFTVDARVGAPLLDAQIVGNSSSLSVANFPAYWATKSDRLVCMLMSNRRTYVKCMLRELAGKHHVIAFNRIHTVVWDEKRGCFVAEFAGRKLDREPKRINFYNVGG